MPDCEVIWSQTQRNEALWDISLQGKSSEGPLTHVLCATEGLDTGFRPRGLAQHSRLAGAMIQGVSHGVVGMGPAAGGARGCRKESYQGADGLCGSLLRVK